MAEPGPLPSKSRTSVHGMGQNLLPWAFHVHCRRLGGWRECGFACVLIGGCDGEQDTTLCIFMKGSVARMNHQHFVEEIHVVYLP